MKSFRAAVCQPFRSLLWTVVVYFVLSANSALAQLRGPGDPPPPRTPTDDWNDMIGTFVSFALLAIAVIAIAWLIFWGFRKMRHARLHKNR